jgi:hypothetical protein
LVTTGHIDEAKNGHAYIEHFPGLNRLRRRPDNVPLWVEYFFDGVAISRR